MSIIQTHEGRYVEKLPDTYRQDEKAINHGFLSSIEDVANQTYFNMVGNNDYMQEDVSAKRTPFAGLLDVLDVNKTYGKTLDYYGEIASVPRGEMNDTQYRFTIMTGINHNFVGGDINTVTNALLVIFNVNAGEILLNDDPNRHAWVKVTKIPFKLLNEIGYSSHEVLGLIKKLLPIGVGVWGEHFEGTFTLFETYAPENPLKPTGLAAEYTKGGKGPGGYLGLVFGEDNTRGKGKF